MESWELQRVYPNLRNGTEDDINDDEVYARLLAQAEKKSLQNMPRRIDVDNVWIPVKVKWVRRFSFSVLNPDLRLVI